MANPFGPQTHWYQFTLRSLLVFVALVLLGVAAWRTYIERYRYGWGLEALTRAALRQDEVARETRILIWAVESPTTPAGRFSDEESCIVWVRLRDETQVLAHLYRGGSQWYMYEIMDARSYACRRKFDHAPTNDEIYEFLHNTWWKFTPRPGFHFVDAAVSIEDWKAVTGQEPTVLYENQSGKR